MPVVSKILVIENDENLARLICFRLEKDGHKVIYCRTAEQAMTKLEEKPNLIWLDYYLPGMNGYEFLQKLKLINGYQDIPVFVVSCSQGVQKNIEKIKGEKIVDYFIKSEVNINDIGERIKKYLSDHKNTNKN